MLLTRRKKRRLHDKFLVFLLKTASTVQLCFYVSGPFSQVLSHMSGWSDVENEQRSGCRE